MTNEFTPQTPLKLWPNIPSREFKNKDFIPFGSSEDIGRRILRRSEESWGSIGVVIDFCPLQEVRVNKGSMLSGEIGDEITQLHKEGHVDTWLVLYGDNSQERIDANQFIHGLQTYSKALTSSDIRNALKVTSEMLEPESIPPGFELQTTLNNVKNTSKYQPAVVDEILCETCRSGADEDKLLLCDKCEKGYHIYCLTPPLLSIPKGAWACPSCVEIFECDVCHKLFKSKGGYRYHIANVCLSEENLLNDFHNHDKDISGDRKLNSIDVDKSIPGRVTRNRRSISTYASDWNSHNTDVKNNRLNNNDDNNDDDESDDDDDNYQDEDNDESDDEESESDDEESEDKYDTSSKRRTSRNSTPAKRSRINISHDKSGRRKSTRSEYSEDRSYSRSKSKTNTSRVMNKKHNYHMYKSKFQSNPIYEFVQSLSIPLSSSPPSQSSILNESRNPNHDLQDIWNEIFIPLSVWAQSFDPHIKIPDTNISVQDGEKITLIQPFTGLWRGSNTTNNSSSSSSSSSLKNLNNLNDSNRDAFKSNSEESRSLSHFAKKNDRDLLNVDCFINSAGPIWDIAFVPEEEKSIEIKSSFSSNDKDMDHEILYEKYFAIGLSRIGWPQSSEFSSDIKSSDKTRIKLTDSTFTGKFGFAQDKPRILGKSVKHPNLLQIWRLKKMKDYSFQSFDIPFINMMGQESHQSLNPMNQKHDDTVVPSTSGEPNTSVELTYCIGLDKRGPTWKVCWSPHDFVSNNNNSDKGIYKNLLGVLAIVCGDGSCLVLILPKLIHDYKYYRKKYFNVIDNENQIPDTQDHQKIHVLAESRVCRWEIKMNRNPVMSVSWNPHVSGQLCCGMLDGTITIWNLPMHNSDNASGDTSNQQPVNEPAVQNIKLKKTKMKLSVPSVLFTDVIVDPFTPAVSAVTCARFCPYHPHLLASSGFDGVIKIWNVKDRYKPKLIIKPLIGWVYDVKWDPHGFGLICCGSDNTSIYWDPLWSVPAFSLIRKNLYNHMNKFAGVWKVHLFSYDGQTGVVSVASDGSVRCMLTSHSIFCRGKLSDVGLFELMRVNDVQSQSLHESSMSSDRLQSNKVAGNDDNGEDAREIGLIFLTLDKDNITTKELNIMKSNGIPSPVLSIHAVDVAIISVKHSDEEELCLFAYGGASGLVRLHTRNLRYDFTS